jgi:hypothetical protein
MTTDLLELEPGAPDLWEGGVADADDEGYRCGCADCRALRGCDRKGGGEAGRRDA